MRLPCGSKALTGEGTEHFQRPPALPFSLPLTSPGPTPSPCAVIPTSPFLTETAAAGREKTELEELFLTALPLEVFKPLGPKTPAPRGQRGLELQVGAELTRPLNAYVQGARVV